MGLSARGLTGIATLPGFEASLRLLIEREQYSLTDIAAMYGVSRERIRQLCARFAIASPSLPGLHAMRVWDDQHHRFIPVPRAAYQHGVAVADVRTRREQRHARRQARQQRVVDTYQHLCTTLHRTPTLAEWATAVCGGPLQRNESGRRLIAAFHPRSKLRDLYAAAHATPRQRGGAGHITRPRRPRPHLSLTPPMADFDFTLRTPTGHTHTHRVHSTDVVAATRIVRAEYPDAPIVDCVAVQDVLWAVREVEAQARAS